MGRRRRVAAGPRALARSGAVVAAALAPVLLAAPGAATPREDCASAEVFQSLDRLTTAVALYDAAEQAGAPCGSSAAADAVRGVHAEARGLTARGRLAELLGRDALALARYRAASGLNAEDEAADAAAERLTADPFAAAERLDELGHRDEAEAAALGAVEAGEVPEPGSPAEQLVDRGPLDRARAAVVRFLESWWAAAALVAVVVLVLLAAVARRQGARRFRWLRRVPPRLRLAVDVQQASGTQPDLAAGFAVQVRTRVRELSARYADDPRVVYGSDAPVDVPLEAVPGQAKYLAALWRWFRRSNTVTLRVTLLPASREGVGCHVGLLERDGSPAPGVGLPEQVLWHRPALWHFDPSADKPLSSFQWMPLANLATAWALFAFRSLQVPSVVLDDEFGTAFGAAYREMLAGLEEEDSPKAMRHFRKALEIDETFVEAHLNLASALGNSTSPSLRENDLAEAERILEERVLRVAEGTLERPGLADEARVRWRVLWFRAKYSVVMVQFNKLAPVLGDARRRADARAWTRTLLEAAESLESWVLRSEPAAGAEPAQRVDPSPPRSSPRSPGARRRRELDRRLAHEQDPLVVLKRQMGPHVRLLVASALDLQAKLSGPSTTRFLPLDLDPGQTPDPGQRRAVEIIGAIPMTGTPTRLHYTLACTWARDYRMRPDEPAEEKQRALARCAERLDAAMEDALFTERWAEDPDLRPILSALEPALSGQRREVSRAP